MDFFSWLYIFSNLLKIIVFVWLLEEKNCIYKFHSTINTMYFSKDWLQVANDN